MRDANPAADFFAPSCSSFSHLSADGPTPMNETNMGLERLSKKAHLIERVSETDCLINPCHHVIPAPLYEPSSHGATFASGHLHVEFILNKLTFAMSASEGKEEGPPRLKWKGPPSSDGGRAPAKKVVELNFRPPPDCLPNVNILLLLLLLSFFTCAVASCLARWLAGHGCEAGRGVGPLSPCLAPALQRGFFLASSLLGDFF